MDSYTRFHRNRPGTVECAGRNSLTPLSKSMIRYAYFHETHACSTTSFKIIRISIFVEIRRTVQMFTAGHTYGRCHHVRPSLSYRPTESLNNTEQYQSHKHKLEITSNKFMLRSTYAHYTYWPAFTSNILRFLSVVRYSCLFHLSATGLRCFQFCVYNVPLLTHTAQYATNLSIHTPSCQPRWKILASVAGQTFNQVFRMRVPVPSYRYGY